MTSAHSITSLRSVEQLQKPDLIRKFNFLKKQERWISTSLSQTGRRLKGGCRRRRNWSPDCHPAVDGYHVLSEAYDYQRGDLFAIQDEIALAIVDKLKVELFPEDKTALVKRYTENLQAYHLYLKGRYFWNKRFVPGAMQKAMDYFQQAIAADSQYALAYTGLADAYIVLSAFWLEPPRKAFPLAEHFLEKDIRNRR